MATVTTTIQNGRLGNQIIRNIAVSRIAEKHNLKVEYCSKRTIEQLGILLFSGTQVHVETRPLTDENYFDIYSLEPSSFVYNLDPNNHYFQTRQISNWVYDYFHINTVKRAIIEKNPYETRYNQNNDMFIHIRLKDVAHHNPGVQYYLNTIEKINGFAQLYISTDDVNHPIVQTICNKYPSTKLLNCDEITTFQFASTCKHIILSHGSFSAIIGYLAFYSTVYYPEYEPNKIWYGDMFSIPGWIQCPTAIVKS